MHISRYYYHETTLAMGDAPDWLLDLAQSSHPRHRGEAFTVNMPSLSKAQTAYALALYLLMWFPAGEMRSYMCMAVTWLAIDVASGMHDIDRDFSSLAHIRKYAEAFDTGHGRMSALAERNAGVARAMYHRLLFSSDVACIRNASSEHIRAILGLSNRTPCIEVQLCNYDAHCNERARAQRQQTMRQLLDALPLSTRMGLGLYRLLELHVDVSDTEIDRDCFLTLQSAISLARDCEWTADKWSNYLSAGVVVGWNPAGRCACDTGPEQMFRHRFGCDPFQRVYVTVDEVCALAYSFGALQASAIPGTDGSAVGPSLFLFSCNKADRAHSFWRFWYDDAALKHCVPITPHWPLVEELIDAFYCFNQRAFVHGPFVLPSGLQEALVPTIAFAQWVRSRSREELRRAVNSTSPMFDAQLDVIVTFLEAPARWNNAALASAVAGLQVEARCAVASAATVESAEPSLYQEDPPVVGRL